MANWELSLVTKVIDTGEFRVALREQIAGQVFHTAEAHAIWVYVDEIYRTKGKIPTRAMVKSVFPRVKLPTDVPDDLAVLCDHVRKGHLSTELQKYAMEISELAPTSPEEAAARLSTAATVIAQSSRVGDDLILDQNVTEARREYELNKRLRLANKVLGIEYPWKPMTVESNGMMPEEFILFYGRPKNMKTFITCHVAADVYFRQHRKVLFFTKEMSPAQIRARVLCSIAKIDYRDYRKGMIPEDQEEEFFEVMEGLRIHGKKSVVEHGRRKESMFIIASDTRSDGGGVTALSAMIEQYEPDIVFVDGIYLMRDDRKGERSRDWKNVANITSDLKNAATHYKIPIVGNTQANRLADDKKKGGGLRDLAFSDAAGQDADLIIRVQKSVDDNNQPILNLVVSGSREFALDGIVIGAEPCVDFDFKFIKRDKATPKEQREEAKAQAVEAAHTAKLERGDENKSFGTREVKAKGVARDPNSRIRRAQRNRPHAEEVVEPEEGSNERTRARDKGDTAGGDDERIRAR